MIGIITPGKHKKSFGYFDLKQKIKMDLENVMFLTIFLEDKLPDITTIQYKLFDNSVELYCGAISNEYPSEILDLKQFSNDKFEIMIELSKSIDSLENNSKLDSNFKNNKKESKNEGKNKVKEKVKEDNESLNKKDNENKPIDYYFILDFEANNNLSTETNKKKVSYEIIEFPVLALNSQTLKVDYTFHHYIKPTIMTTLSKEIIELTGISQDTVDKGIILTDCFDLFEKWLSENGLKDKNFVFVTCGDWDLMTCLRQECKLKKIEYKEYFKSWINIKTCFKEYFKKDDLKIGMDGMLKMLNLTLDGKHHSGIDDCKNISKIAVELLMAKIDFSKNITKIK